MDEAGLARCMAEVERALDELARGDPAVRPATIDERGGTVRLGSGEHIALGPLLVDLAKCPPELASGMALNHLLRAKAAARDLARLDVGSWAAMSPRLGLVLRRRRRDLIGPSIGTELILAAMVDAGRSLIPANDKLLTRWGQGAQTVIDIAAANTIDQSVERHEIELGTGSGPTSRTTVRPAAFVALGGSFTTGRLVDIDSLAGPIGAGGALATCLGDRALLVARLGNGEESGDPSNLVHALQNLADDLRRKMSIRPSHDMDAILRCRSGSQVAIFGTGGDGE